MLPLMPNREENIERKNSSIKPQKTANYQNLKTTPTYASLPFR